MQNNNHTVKVQNKFLSKGNFDFSYTCYQHKKYMQYTTISDCHSWKCPLK